MTDAAVAVEDQLQEIKESIGLGEQERFGSFFDLAKLPARTLALLMARDFVSHDALYAVVYHDKLPQDRPEPHHLAVLISKIRKNIREKGIEVKVHNKSGEGWSMSLLDKQKIKNAMRNGVLPAPAFGDDEEYPVSIGIPIPSKVKYKYPFDRMTAPTGAADMPSFFVPGGNEHKVRNTCRSFKKQMQHEDWIFVTRTLVENGVKGIRVWREK